MLGFALFWALALALTDVGLGMALGAAMGPAAMLQNNVSSLMVVATVASLAINAPIMAVSAGLASMDLLEAPSCSDPIGGATEPSGSAGAISCQEP